MTWGNLRVGLMIHNLKRPYKQFIWILLFYRKNCSRRDWGDLGPTRINVLRYSPIMSLFASCTKGCFKSLCCPSSWAYQHPLHSEEMNGLSSHRKNRNCKTKTFPTSCCQLWIDTFASFFLQETRGGPLLLEANMFAYVVLPCSPQNCHELSIAI